MTKRDNPIDPKITGPVPDFLRQCADVYEQRALKYVDDTGDWSSNFAYVARHLNAMDPTADKATAAWALMGVKLARLDAAFRTGRTDFADDSLIDSLTDLANYSAILACILMEQRSEYVPVPEVLTGTSDPERAELFGEPEHTIDEIGDRR